MKDSSAGPKRQDQGPEEREQLQRQRGLSDAKKRRERAHAEQERDTRRAVHDRTLHHARGTRQERESLERERRSDDADLQRERAVADELTSAERSLTNEVVEGLVEAGERQRTLEAEESSRARRRGALLEDALAELARIDATASSLLKEEPSGPGGVLTEGLDAVRSSVGRARRALERAHDLR